MPFDLVAVNLLSLYNAVTGNAYINEVVETALELKVMILNVNEGHNEELMKHCTTLKEYAQYVAKVCRYAAKLSLEAAVKRANDESIEEGNLEDFLQKNQMV